MKINVGDKVLLKKVEDLPERLKENEENVKNFSKFAGKVCTVSRILNKNPLIFELEEDENADAESLFKYTLVSAWLGFDNRMTKEHHFTDVYIEKVVSGDEKAKSFGWALRQLKKGLKVARKGWNGKGLWLELQRPDEHSKMTLPYIYMNYPKGDKYHDGCRVPWLASQTDMLEEDWYEVK